LEEIGELVESIQAVLLGLPALGVVVCVDGHLAQLAGRLKHVVLWRSRGEWRWVAETRPPNTQQNTHQQEQQEQQQQWTAAATTTAKTVTLHSRHRESEFDWARQRWLCKRNKQTAWVSERKLREKGRNSKQEWKTERTRDRGQGRERKREKEREKGIERDRKR
jgi:hypothetical protein